MSRSRTKNWDEYGAPKADSLRKVIEAAISARSEQSVRQRRAAVAEAAGVLEHDVNNLLSGCTPKHRPGLKILNYAADLPIHGEGIRLDIDPYTLDEIRSARDLIRKAVPLELDEDYFFLHLKRIGLADEEKCAQFCRTHQGNYYAYRLSHSKNKVVKSHLKILRFNNYNKLPNFTNIVRYNNSDQKRKAEGKNIKRTARGQIVAVGNFYAFIGLVFYGSDPDVALKNRGPKLYRGAQINIMPQQGFGGKNTQGYFLSYIFEHGYEYGPMLLNPCNDDYDKNNVGVFDIAWLAEHDPELQFDLLKLDVSKNIEPAGLAAMLATCLSFNPVAGRDRIGSIDSGAPGQPLVADDSVPRPAGRRR